MQTRFKTSLFLSVLVFSFLFMIPAYAPVTNHSCINDTTAQAITYLTINNGTTTTNYTIDENISCNFNCSTTLHGCRWDEYIQMTTFIGIIVAAFLILVFAVWIGRRFLMVDFAIYAIMMMFFALMGGVLDVFIARYQTIFLVMTFVPVGFFFFSLWVNLRIRKEAKGEKRATGR